MIGAAWQAQAIDRLVRDYEVAMPAGAAPNWVLGNHDKPRIASRIGAGGARLAAMLLLTLRGTPTLYYGDELGMTDVPIPLAEVQDPFERRAPGHGLGRDPQRTPRRGWAWPPMPASAFGASIYTVDVPRLPGKSAAMYVWLSTWLDRQGEVIAGGSTMLRPEKGLILGPWYRLYRP